MQRQSNMGKPLSFADGSAPYLADAPITTFAVPHAQQRRPVHDHVASLDATTAAAFPPSATGWSRSVEDLNVPVGLIQASYDVVPSKTGNTAMADRCALRHHVVPLQPYASRPSSGTRREQRRRRQLPTQTDHMISEWRNEWACHPAVWIVQLPATKWTASRIAQSECRRQCQHLPVSPAPSGRQPAASDRQIPVGIRSGIGQGSSTASRSSTPVGSGADVVRLRRTSWSTLPRGYGLMTADGLRRPIPDRYSDRQIRHCDGDAVATRSK